MRVEGNSIEVRAKFRKRIIEGNPIPQIPDPGPSFATFQEEEKRIKSRLDHNVEVTRAQKKTRSHHLKLERILEKLHKEKHEHDERIAFIFKVLMDYRVFL
jgi:hypothetical protein